MTQLQAMLLSVLFELPVVLALGLRRRPAGTPWTRLALVGVAMTLITHRFAWTLNQELAAWPFAPRAALVEGLVVLLEGALLARWARLGWRDGYAVALVANATSFGLGLLVFAGMRA